MSNSGVTEDVLIGKVPVLLQSCTMSEEVLQDSCNETSVTSPDSAHEVISIKVEDGIDVDTEEQVIPVSILFSPLKAEQDMVSYVSLCPVLDTFTQYSVMPAVLCCLHVSACPTTPVW
jgi:hypothetical protein